MEMGVEMGTDHTKTRNPILIMAMKPDFDIIIIGGGLAGLVLAMGQAVQLRHVLLIEKKTYPAHKVCGEYVSLEVLPYLRSFGFDPFALGAAQISKLRISTPGGKSIHTPLDLGGFALSRYTMDHALSELAQKKGVSLLTGTRVTNVVFREDHFVVETNSGQHFTAGIAVGCYGKRETLDKKLNRPFIDHRTGYMGVKYHIRTDYPVNEIGLDNFSGGYCGIVKIEGDRYNLCNFYQRGSDKRHRSIREFEETVVFRNPVIKSIFSSSDFLFDEPVVINEICFDPKSPVEDHLLMCGDSAGLITPLCGNGMSMAIGGAKLLNDLLNETGIVGKAVISAEDRLALENEYQRRWANNFKRRLFWGRTIQRFFGNRTMTALCINTIHAIPPLERMLIRATHGTELV